MQTDDITAAGLATLVSAHRFHWNSEDDLQRGLTECLTSYGYPVQREVRLSARDRIDLLVHRVGVEVKVASIGRAAPIERVLTQLKRYAESDEVDELLLVTTTLKHRLPDGVTELNGKPVRVVLLAGGLR